MVWVLENFQIEASYYRRVINLPADLTLSDHRPFIIPAFYLMRKIVIKSDIGAYYMQSYPMTYRKLVTLNKSGQ